MYYFSSVYLLFVKIVMQLFDIFEGFFEILIIIMAKGGGNEITFKFSILKK